MRVAIIHDWLLGMRGGEYCLKVISELFPEADIFTLFYRGAEIDGAIKKHQIFESNFSSLPHVEKYYRYLLPCFSVAVRDLSRKLEQQHQKSPYDLVISVSHCVAKNVAIPKGAYHLCYCLTPARYLWDQYDSYFLKHPLEPIIRRIFRPLRRWDARSATGVDRFVAISDYISQRINRYYGQSASVVYPPVITDWISASPPVERGGRFLSVSALVPYKSVDLIIEAFNELPCGLDIVGRGPEESRLRKLAKRGNIRFLGTVSQEELARLYKSAKALVFSAEEDFGMAPVEMQAGGGPVIAFGRGGVLETVQPQGPCATGVFFYEKNTRALLDAVSEFNSRQADFTVDNCLKQADNFSLENFQKRFLEACLGPAFAEESYPREQRG